MEACGTLLAASCCFGGVESVGGMISAQTTNETNAMHAVGSPVIVMIDLKGLNPGERRKLNITVEDAWAKVVVSTSRVVLADSRGGWHGTYAAPGDRRVFFRLRVDADKGLSLPKLGSRPAGCLTYAVVANPAERAILDEKDSFCGLHGEVYEGGFVAPWLGARQLMDGQRVFADEATYEKELSRRRASGWIAYGYNALSLIQRTNFSSPYLSEEFVRWRMNCGSFWKFFTDPEGRRLYSEAVEKISRAGLRQRFFQKRRLYEALWEPDLSASSPEAIVEACRLTRQALRKGDPEALVMGPTICNVFQKNDYFRRCCEAGVLREVDVFSVHAYTPYPPEPAGFVRNIRTVRDLVRRYGAPDMPMVSTEHGFQAAAVRDEELLQMNGMIRQQLILLGEGFLFGMPFVVKDFGGDFADRPEGDYGLFYNLKLSLPNNRWGSNRLSPRPVAAALAAFSEMLDGFRPTAVLETLGDTILGYAYSNAQGKVVIALWDWGDEPSTVTIPVGTQTVEVVDIMGNAVRRHVPDGNLRLELGQSPVYVRGLSASAWGIGGSCVAKVAAKARQDRMLREARRKVSVGEIRPACRKGRHGIRCRLENLTDGELRVALSASGAFCGGRKMTLSPRESRRVGIVLKGNRPNPLEVCEIAVTAEPEGGERVTRTAKLNFLPAKKLPAVGRNGDFSGWTQMDYFEVPATAVRHAAGHHGAADLSAKMAFGWNEDYLLVDVVTEDDEHVQDKTGWWTWGGDCIQMGFADKRLDRLSANALADALEQAASEVTFSLTEKGPEACRTQSFDPVRYPCDQSGNGQLSSSECPFSVERTDLPDGRVRLHYRVAYPWSFMGRTVAPAAGGTCMFAALIADRDGDMSEPSCLGVFELQPNAPAGFGYVCLEDGSED